jgi:serine/threonine protein kinase
VFKRNKTKLPFTAAYSAESDKIFIFCKEHRLKKLGEGGNSKVTVGWDVKAQTEVAIRSATEGAITTFECKVHERLSAFKHLFVLADEIFNYTGPFAKRQDNILLKKIEVPKTAMVLEKMQTSLDEIKEFLNLRNIVEISQAIAQGLNVLHDKFKIVHRDLKTTNILIKKFDKKMKTIEGIKIADFGFAHNKNTYTDDWCDHCYMPPEMKLDRLHYDKEYYQMGKVTEEVKMILSNTKFPNNADSPEDMWSFGVILLEMISPPNIFKLWHKTYNNDWELDSGFSNDKKEIFDDIREAYELAPVLERGIIESFIHIINRCLIFNPTQRLTAKEALEKINEIINNISSSESNKQKGEK